MGTPQTQLLSWTYITTHTQQSWHISMAVAAQVISTTVHWVGFCVSSWVRTGVAAPGGVCFPRSVCQSSRVVQTLPCRPVAVERTWEVNCSYIISNTHTPSLPQYKHWLITCNIRNCLNMSRPRALMSRCTASLLAEIYSTYSIESSHTKGLASFLHWSHG